jgi:hypothetical protein
LFLNFSLHFRITPVFLWWCCPCVWHLHTNGMKHRISTGWFGLTSLKEVFGYNCIKQYFTWDCNFVIYFIIISSFAINMDFFWSVHESSKTVATSSIWSSEWLFSKRCFANFVLLLPALKGVILWYNDLLVCPVYFLLHSGHLIWYISLFKYLSRFVY